MHSDITGPCGALVAGDLASWVAAIGTLGAFAVALVVFRQSVETQRVAQARLVNGYLEGMPKALPPGHVLEKKEMASYYDSELGAVLKFGTGKKGSRGVKAVTLPKGGVIFAWHVDNLSDETINDLRAELLSGTGETLRTLIELRTLPPGGSSERRDCVPDDMTIDGGAVVRLTFRDAVGLEWQRDTGAALKRLKKGIVKPVQSAGIFTPGGPSGAVGVVTTNAARALGQSGTPAPSHDAPAGSEFDTQQEELPADLREYPEEPEPEGDNTAE